MERWSKIFRQDREEIEDESRSDGPMTETTVENME